MNAWLDKFPTVGGRVVVTLVCVLATAVAHIGFDKPLSDSWLTFLAVMSGVDGAATVLKRVTAKPEVIDAESRATVKKIEATAAAVPPLTPKEASNAGAKEGE